MTSIRQLKIAQLIKKEMGDILIKQKSILTGNAFVTITDVEITTDLSIAKVYLSVFNSKDTKRIIDNFEMHRGYIKNRLAQKLKNLRRIPEISFFEDETAQTAFKIDKMLKDIRAADESM